MVQLVRYERLKHNTSAASKNDFRDNSDKQVPAPLAARCETITRDYIQTHIRHVQLTVFIVIGTEKKFTVWFFDSLLLSNSTRALVFYN